MTEIIQGSPEWYAIRCGKVTASRIASLTAKTKTGISAMRDTYMGELIAERLSNLVQPMFVSQEMQWGTDNEAAARAAYAYEVNTEIVQVGFVDHPRIKMSGASPDGLVGDDGLVEIKCPNTSTHCRTMRSKTVPSTYVKQMMWQMACTGRQWNDFFSFDPRLPDEYSAVRVRLMRDPKMIVELEAEVSEFIAELDAAVAEMRASRMKEAA